MYQFFQTKHKEIASIHIEIFVTGILYKLYEVGLSSLTKPYRLVHENRLWKGNFYIEINHLLICFSCQYEYYFDLILFKNKGKNFKIVDSFLLLKTTITNCTLSFVGLPLKPSFVLKIHQVVIRCNLVERSTNFQVLF